MHSSKDRTIISAVKQALNGVGLRPVFYEDQPAGDSPAVQISRIIAGSRGLLAFLTPNSLASDTRDWVVFELGIGFSLGRPIFAWRDKRLRRNQIPRLLSQITTYRDCESTHPLAVTVLIGEVREAARLASHHIVC